MLKYKLISNESEFESFRKSVQYAGLPHQDLNYNTQILIGYYDNHELVGTGGLEILDRFALLRSVSVSENHRNKNIGKQITSDIVANAKQSNLDAVYLLTETAQDYFQKLGFEKVERESIPHEVKSTSEFAHGCPASAIAMVMKL